MTRKLTKNGPKIDKKWTENRHKLDLDKKMVKNLKNKPFEAELAVLKTKVDDAVKVDIVADWDRLDLPKVGGGLRRQNSAFVHKTSNA